MGGSASASACAPTIRCATATSRWRSAIRCSSTQKERDFMLSLAARSALSGIALPGRYGRAGATGLVIEEVTDLAFASIMCKREKHFALINAVHTAFGIVLPDGPRRVTRGHVTFAGVGPDQWMASADGADAAGFAARVRARIGPFAAGARQSHCRLGLRVRGPRGPRVVPPGGAVDP